jgi:alkylation response protein AidB-like acyl-CoA dehydrogenase
MGPLAHTLAIEEIARGCGSTALAVLGHASLGIRFLLEGADEHQRTSWIPDLASGEKFVAFALANEGTPAAEKHGDGYVLNGTSRFVIGAAAADLVLWISRSGPNGSLVTAFALEKGTPGLDLVPGEDRLGMRGAGWADVRLEACSVPSSRRIGLEGTLVGALARTLESAQAALAVLAIGMGERALELARRYSKERVAFGKPLAAQQAVTLKLAEMRMRIDGARQLARHAARLDAHGAVDFGREALTARVHATEAATFCGDEAIQVHGGYGFTTEYTVERIYREAKTCEVILGTNEQCRLDLARRIVS